MSESETTPLQDMLVARRHSSAGGDAVAGGEAVAAAAAAARGAAGGDRRRRRSSNNNSNTAAGDDVLDELDVNVNFKSESFTSIFGPVVLTMTLAAVAVVNINSPTTESLGEGLKFYVPTGLTPDAGDGAGTDFLKSAGFAFLVIAFICAATFVIVLCIRFNCMRALVGYMLFSTTMLLGFMGGTAVYAVIEMYAVPADWFSFILVMYNFAMVGVIAIFWGKGVDHVWTNAYLVAVSVILAFELAQFNTVGEWIPWCLLGALALYDLCAVLTPCGPLRLLLNAVENSDGGEQAISGLLFEADVGQHRGAAETAKAEQRQVAGPQQPPPRQQGSPHPRGEDGGGRLVIPPPPPGKPPRLQHGESKDLETGLGVGVGTPVHQQDGARIDGGGSGGRGPPAHRSIPPRSHGTRGPPPPAPPPGQRRRPRLDNEDDEDEGLARGVKLGLGDFIFYSVLVSTAARHDFITFASCTLVVLLGLGMTLLLLIVAGKALPVLPISVFLGVFFYFVGRYTLEPYVDNMTVHGLVV